MERRAFWVASLLFGFLSYFLSNAVFLNPDGVGYFAYLPSLFQDTDLELYNQFRQMLLRVPLSQTPNGYTATNWPIGPAFFWLPFYALGELLWVWGYGLASDGTGSWFWRFVNWGTLFYGFSSFLLWIQILRLVRCEWRPALGIVVAAAVGTPFLYYVWIVPSTSHGVSAFSTTLLLYVWIWGAKKSHPWRWFLGGILCGISSMVRPQNGLWLLLPWWEWLWGPTDKRRGQDLGFLGLGFIFGASPQLLVNQIFYGDFWRQPAAFNLRWEYFALDSVLFSSYHGILFWTPLFCLSLFGCLLACRRAARDSIVWPLTLIFVGQVLVNSFVVAWWEGYSFGQRQMCGVVPIAVLGIYWVLERFRKYSRTGYVLGWGAVLASSGWTLVLLGHSVRTLSLVDYVGPAEILLRGLRFWEGLAGIFQALSQSSRPGWTVWFLVFLFSWVLGVSAHFLIREARVRNLRRLAGVFGAWVVLVNGWLLWAHSRKPEVSFSPLDWTVPYPEYPRFFIQQALEYKEKLP